MGDLVDFVEYSVHNDELQIRMSIEVFVHFV
jgi:hypothetical protein